MRTMTEKEFIAMVQDGPAYTDEAKTEGLEPADPNNAVEMAPHIAAMKKAIDVAATNPDKFYYQVLVIGKDGKKPLAHGTMPRGLNVVTLSAFTLDPMVKAMIGFELSMGKPEAVLAYEWATGEHDSIQIEQPEEDSAVTFDLDEFDTTDRQPN